MVSLNVLAGYKTYIVAVAIVLVGLGDFVQGTTDLTGFINQILGGLGLATLRVGINNYVAGK